MSLSNHSLVALWAQVAEAWHGGSVGPENLRVTFILLLLLDLEVGLAWPSIGGIGYRISTVCSSCEAICDMERVVVPIGDLHEAF